MRFRRDSAARSRSQQAGESKNGEQKANPADHRRHFERSHTYITIEAPTIFDLHQAQQTVSTKYVKNGPPISGVGRGHA